MRRGCVSWVRRGDEPLCVKVGRFSFALIGTRLPHEMKVYQQGQKGRAQIKSPSFFNFLGQCLRSRKPSRVDFLVAAFSALLGIVVWTNPTWLPNAIRTFFQDTESWLVWVVFFGTEFIYRTLMSPYWLHLSSQNRISELEHDNADLKHAFESKLEIACAADIDGCKAGFGHASHGRIFRVAVRNPGVEPIRECRAILVRIETNDKRLWSGDQINLAFQPSDSLDSECKTLTNDLEYYLDVVGVEIGSNTPWNFRPGTKGHKWVSSPAFEQLFSAGKGDYVFTISFTAPAITTITKRFLLHWTGNIQSAEMYMID